MKKALLAALSAIATVTVSFAGTYTWIGGTDNSWFTDNNWNYSNSGEDTIHKSPKHTIDGDIVIGNRAEVRIETVFGDFGEFTSEPEYTVTVKEGATLIHNKNNWFRLPNVVLDNGSLTNFSCYSALEIYGTVQIRNGGAFVNTSNNPTIAESDITVGDGEFDSKLTLKGTLTIDGGSVSGDITRSGDNSKIVLNSGTLNFSDTVSLPETTTDEYNGGDIVINGELKPPANYVFSNVNWKCVKYVPFEQATTWISGSLTSTNANEPYYGGGKINVPSGSTAKFTFPYSASAVYNSIVKDKFLFEGATITAEDFDQKWAVETSMIDNVAYTTFYLSQDAGWKIGSMSASGISSSGATLTAVLAKTDPSVSDYSVMVAYGPTAIMEGDVISNGEVVTPDNGVYTKILTGLTDGTMYNYAFAIVTNNAIAAFKTDSFFASDFEYIWKDGAWVGGAAPADWATAARVLITGTFSTGEINPENKVLKDAVMTGTTLANGSGPLTLINSTYTNNKQNDLANGVAAYGIYNNSYAVNFTTASGNGVIKHGDAYTCYATEAQCGTVYENLFSTGKMKLNGETVTQALFESNFTTNVVVTELSDGETILSRLTITYWESVLGGGSSTDWTIQPGARVKLAGDTRVGALNIPDAADVKIDLNGHKLTVSSLTVGGETKKGTFTSETLDCLVGNGSLTVAGQGLVIVIR